MNRTFKIISRNVVTKRQQKKRVYTSYDDYMTYKNDLTKRYSQRFDVEHYELIDSKWELIHAVTCRNQ